MTASLPTITQASDPGEIVALFRFDATSVGGNVLYFVQGRIGSASVTFGGQAYTPYDVKIEGMEVNAGGSLPQPKLTLANSDTANGFVQNMINTFGDLVGCEIRRIRTFRSCLDDGANPDPTAYIGPDVFKIERKAEENPDFVEYELSASIDQEGVMLPRRQIIRDTCAKRYRFYDPSNPNANIDGFVYPTKGDPCPYTGSPCFDANDQPTTAANDICSFQLSGCKARFGAANTLPFGGFPGAARVQQ